MNVLRVSVIWFDEVHQAELLWLSMQGRHVDSRKIIDMVTWSLPEFALGSGLSKEKNGNKQNTGRSDRPYAYEEGAGCDENNSKGPV